MSKFLQRKYWKLESYKPGEQPESMDCIKLNTNESPFPPGPEVIAVLQKKEAENLNLYPDPECSRLKDKIASAYGMKRENIFVANGSDDILNFAFMAFAGEDTPVLFPDITYGFYTVFAEFNGIPYSEVPLKPDFSVDPTDYLCQNKMIVLANPNAPTGKALLPYQIESVVRTNPDTVVVIDEAYVDFGAESCVDLVHRYENLLVVQTFSKSRSLAGARLGFAIGQPGLIADLERMKYAVNPYNVNRLSVAIGVAALKENDYYMGNCQNIIENREYTERRMKEMGFQVIESKANFLFVKKDGIAGSTLYEKLRERGILIRHFSNEKITAYNRITVGTREQMDLLLNEVEEILDEEGQSNGKNQ